MIWNMVQTARTCVVTFKSSVDESVLYTVEVDAGSSVTYGGKTPTKSSTAQYTYTFSGWSRTKGGSAVSGILNDIEDDITLWSAFTSTVRKYTITWKNYDGTTLKTESVAYGTTPKWSGSNPTFAGWTFTGWNPSLKSVTGAATYTATYSLPNGMSQTLTKDWDTIIADSSANRTSGYSTGQTRVALLTSNTPLCYELAGINVETDGHFTFISKTIDGTYSWNSSNNNAGGYPSSQLKKRMEGTVLNYFPSNIKKAMKTVTKYCYSYFSPNKVLDYTAQIWPPGSRNMNYSNNMEQSGPAYTFYDSNSRRIRYDSKGTAQNAWLSTVPYRNDNTYYHACYIKTDGSNSYGYCSSSYGILPCFVL